MPFSELIVMCSTAGRALEFLIDIIQSDHLMLDPEICQSDTVNLGAEEVKMNF
jgi:hypothetical protein